MVIHFSPRHQTGAILFVTQVLDCLNPFILTREDSAGGEFITFYPINLTTIVNFLLKAKVNFTVHSATRFEVHYD